MSLKDSYERILDANIRLEREQAKKLAEKEKYKMDCEQYCKVIPALKALYDTPENTVYRHDYRIIYQKTLVDNLCNQEKELVNEFIQLCPNTAWKKASVQAPGPCKYRLADNSIHIAHSMPMCDAQYVFGQQWYVILPYETVVDDSYGNGQWYKFSMIIFIDGYVHDMNPSYPWNCSPLYNGKKCFEGFLAAQLASYKRSGKFTSVQYHQ